MHEELTHHHRGNSTANATSRAFVRLECRPLADRESQTRRDGRLSSRAFYLPLSFSCSPSVGSSLSPSPSFSFRLVLSLSLSVSVCFFDCFLLCLFVSLWLLSVCLSHCLSPSLSVSVFFYSIFIFSSLFL